MTNDTLYDRLGGEDAIEAVVDRFYERLLDDDQVNGFFEDTDVNELRAHQAQFISAVTGGPVDYTGAEMEEAHAHLAIDERDFEIVAVHLDETLGEFDVPDDERETVMAEISSYEDAIVTA